MIHLIKGGLSKIPGWVAQILIYTILFLFILYILCFFSIAIGNIAATSGLYNLSYNVSPSSPLTKILEHFPRDNVDIINIAGIIIMLFLWLLLLGIFKAEKGIVILPFLVDPGDKNFNGSAISEMLIAELKRIIRIHSVNTESNRSSSEEMELSASSKNLSAIYPIKDVKEKAHLLQLSPKGENLDQSIQTIGTLAFSSTSVPIGSVLVVLRDICPGADPGLIISGCLQKSESDICLISYMKRENRSWRVHKKIENSKTISNEDLSALVSELSYNIYYDLLQLQSKQNISDSLKNLYRKEPPGKAPNHDLPSWEVLNYFTEAMAALQTYNITKEKKDLDRARVLGLKAASIDPYYNNPLYLLYNIGIAYINNLNKKDYYEAERLARYVVALRPDSSRAWYSWGLTLTILIMNDEAIKCYNKALFFDKFEKEEKDKIEKDIKFMRAISLRRLKNYDEAIEDFEYFLGREDMNGYAWGHYGITLEAKAKSLDMDVKLVDCKSPEDDKKKLKECFSQRYGDWVKSAGICYTREMITFSNGKNSLSINLKNETIEINGSVDKFKIVKKGNDQFAHLTEDALRDKAEKAFQKAILYQPDFVSVHAALARIYRKKYALSWDKICGDDKEKFIEFLRPRCGDWVKSANPKRGNNEITLKSPDGDWLDQLLQKKQVSMKVDVNKKEATLKTSIGTEKFLAEQEGATIKVYLMNPFKECEQVKIYKQTRRQTKYNRACYEINCEDNKKIALKLLDEEISQNQVSKQWLEDDPDLDPVREDEEFRILLSKAKDGKSKDIDNSILKYAVARRLNPENPPKDVQDNEKKDLEEKSFLVRARFHAVSGNDDEALNLLYWALKYDEIDAEEAQFEPDFEFIRDKPGFKDMMERFSECKRANS